MSAWAPCAALLLRPSAGQGSICSKCPAGNEAWAASLPPLAEEPMCSGPALVGSRWECGSSTAHPEAISVAHQQVSAPENLGPHRARARADTKHKQSSSGLHDSQGVLVGGWGGFQLRESWGRGSTLGSAQDWIGAWG